MKEDGIPYDCCESNDMSCLVVIVGANEEISFIEHIKCKQTITNRKTLLSLKMSWYKLLMNHLECHFLSLKYSSVLFSPGEMCVSFMTNSSITASSLKLSRLLQHADC